MTKFDLAPGAEFCDLIQLRANFGINRANAYDLIADGEIESINVKRRGMERGRRLINVESVRRYLRSQNAQPSALWVNSAAGFKFREAKRANKKHIQQETGMG